MSAIHYLKTWPQFFEAISRGDKNFEIRKDDRAYQTGDTLVLTYFDPAKPNEQSYHANIERRVTFLLAGGQFGVEPGFVVMGLAPLEDRP